MSTGADGCPSSQIASRLLSAVPLWKVIVGPADELKPDSQEFGFLLRRSRDTCIPTGALHVPVLAQPLGLH